MVYFLDGNVLNLLYGKQAWRRRFLPWVFSFHGPSSLGRLWDSCGEDFSKLMKKLNWFFIILKGDPSSQHFDCHHEHSLCWGKKKISLHHFQDKIVRLIKRWKGGGGGWGGVSQKMILLTDEDRGPLFWICLESDIYPYVIAWGGVYNMSCILVPICFDSHRFGNERRKSGSTARLITR